MRLLVNLLSVALGAGFLLTPTALRHGESAALPILHEGSFDHWRNYIHPSDAELASERIQWQPTLWSGLVQAQEERKPLMVWIMNGHPCGLT